MSFESELVQHLLDSSGGVRALVGTRMYPNYLIQEDPLPAIVYQIIFDERQTDLDGDDGDLSNIRVQLDVWANKYADAFPVRDAIVARLKTAASGIKFVPINAGQTFYESQTKRTRILIEYSCWWRIN